jgi:hypothetical protein
VKKSMSVLSLCGGLGHCHVWNIENRSKIWTDLKSKLNPFRNELDLAETHRTDDVVYRIVCSREERDSDALLSLQYFQAREDPSLIN